MTDLPLPRLSPERRTVVVPEREAIGEALLVAQAAGWELLVARRVPCGVELVLGR
jgi:hypothetical protein